MTRIREEEEVLLCATVTLLSDTARKNERKQYVLDSIFSFFKSLNVIAPWSMYSCFLWNSLLLLA